jgi:DNA adenine methylase
MGTYYEPFCGGAALFFALANEEAPRFRQAVLVDQNADLMAFYTALRDDVDALLRALRKYRYDRDLFYEVRAQSTTKLSTIERGARFLFLNKTCFNGLWRVNSKGQFNVPFGTYKNPKIVDEPSLREASSRLQHVALKHGDFLAVTKRAKSGDFVYFDPPYVPLSRTAQFTAYHSDGFGPDDQQRLRDEMKRLAQADVHVVLSNHDTEDARALYRGFWGCSVGVRRSINSDITKRGLTGELIVSSVKPRGSTANGWSKLK